MLRGVENVFIKIGVNYILIFDGVEIVLGVLMMGVVVELDVIIKIGVRSNNSNSFNVIFFDMWFMQLKIIKNLILYVDFNVMLVNKFGFVFLDLMGNFIVDFVDFNFNGGFWFMQIENLIVISFEINGYQYEIFYIGDIYIEEDVMVINVDGLIE